MIKRGGESPRDWSFDLAPDLSDLDSSHAGGVLHGALERLYESVQAARTHDPATSRTAKLLGEGLPKMAKKVAEEAVEVGIEAVLMRREAVVLESADLLYNLCVLWAASGITPADVTAEISRRERTYGIAEKLPKGAALRELKRNVA